MTENPAVSIIKVGTLVVGTRIMAEVGTLWQWCISTVLTRVTYQKTAF